MRTIIINPLAICILRASQNVIENLIDDQPCHEVTAVIMGMETEEV